MMVVVGVVVVVCVRACVRACGRAGVMRRPNGLLETGSPGAHVDSHTAPEL